MYGIHCTYISLMNINNCPLGYKNNADDDDSLFIYINITLPPIFLKKKIQLSYV